MWLRATKQHLRFNGPRTTSVGYHFSVSSACTKRPQGKCLSPNLIKVVQALGQRQDIKWRIGGCHCLIGSNILWPPYAAGSLTLRPGFRSSVAARVRMRYRLGGSVVGVSPCLLCGGWRTNYPHQKTHQHRRDLWIYSLLSPFSSLLCPAFVQAEAPPHVDLKRGSTTSLWKRRISSNSSVHTICLRSISRHKHTVKTSRLPDNPTQTYSNIKGEPFQYQPWH